MTVPMPFDDFACEVARELGIDRAALTAAANLRTDLGFDSLQMYLLILTIEDLGANVPEELIPHVLTLGDAYHHYVTATGHK
jgi:acyl carrier protein